VEKAVVVHVGVVETGGIALVFVVSAAEAVDLVAPWTSKALSLAFPAGDRAPTGTATYNAKQTARIRFLRRWLMGKLISQGSRGMRFPWLMVVSDSSSV
jgi:hypothetical protein